MFIKKCSSCGKTSADVNMKFCASCGGMYVEYATGDVRQQTCFACAALNNIKNKYCEYCGAAIAAGKV